jgi:hypothetical protein
MQDLIAALTIFSKYGNPRRPTHCEHDIMYVCIKSESVSDEDKAALHKLGFLLTKILGCLPHSDTEAPSYDASSDGDLADLHYRGRYHLPFLVRSIPRPAI